MILALKEETNLPGLCIFQYLNFIQNFQLYWIYYHVFLLYRQVLEIMSATRNEDLYSLANAMYENTKKLFKFWLT